jgi:pimeloyl-ACP methyl ester carboxylesterase
MKLFHREIKGPGSPLLILHGLFGMSDNWQSFARSAAATRHIVLIDQRNHGRSPHSDEFSYPAMADDLLELMDDLHLRQADLLGHSMGGKTVMELATRHPDRVQHLIVADIGPKAYPLHHEYLIDAMESLPLAQLKSRPEAEKMLEAKVYDPGVRQFLLKNLYWEEDSRLAWRFNLKVIKSKLEEVGKPLPAERVFEGPTLFLRGGKSHYILDDDLMDLRQHFPRAVVETIPQAGHWLHAEQPDAFYKAVVGFLDGNLT